MRTLLLGAGLLMISACVSVDPNASPETLYDDAVAAYDAEQPVRAYRLLHAASDAGSFDADFALAEFFGTGRLPHAYPAGHGGKIAPADRIIAFNTFWGGWKHNEERAAQHQERGGERVRDLAASGDLHAMTALGVSLLYPFRDRYGIDTPQDLARGRQLLEQASLAGHANASFRLWTVASMLDLDDNERLEYIARAEAQGHPHGFHMYALTLLGEDPLQGLAYLDQHAENGHAEATEMRDETLRSMRAIADTNDEVAAIIAAWDAGTRS
ncbi:MAG: hypothetical protein AAF730_19130 [Bacteroidota bacterium]